VRDDWGIILARGVGEEGKGDLLESWRKKEGVLNKPESRAAVAEKIEWRLIAHVII
jgi:hypothetical protein